MTETIFTPQSMRTVNIANTTIIGFARNIDDEDSLILRKFKPCRGESTWLWELRDALWNKLKMVICN